MIDFGSFWERWPELSQKESFLLIVDSDLDGAVSLKIFSDALQHLGAKNSLSPYFVKRKEEGYGLSEKLLGFLQKKHDIAKSVFFLFDCGVSDIPQLRALFQLKVPVVIFDHHKILEALPSNVLLLHPQEEGFCTGQLLYLWAKTAFSFFGANQDILLSDFLALSCLSAVFDQVPLKGEPGELISQGFLALHYSKNPAILGLQDYFKITNFDYRTLRELVIPVLSSSEVRPDYSFELYDFLNSSSEKEALVFLKRWQKRREERIKMVLEELERVKERGWDKAIFWEVPSFWSVSMMGSLASRIVTHFKKPALCYMVLSEEALGSVRTPDSVDAVEWLAKGKELLKEFGGHPRAAGFRIKRDNLPSFLEILEGSL